MELILSGVALQVLALTLLALLAMRDDTGEALLVRLRGDGRPEHVPDEAAAARRRLMVKSLIGLFVGGTALALLGFPRL